MKKNLRIIRMDDVLNRYVLLLLWLLLLGCAFMGCHELIVNPGNEEQNDSVDVTFQIELDEQIYQTTPYGHPPQMAIWLQNQEDRSIRNVLVTYRMGAGDWKGKTTCGTCLPYWMSFYNRQTGTSGPPTREHPAPDTMTYATPKDILTIHAAVPKGSCWNYFIEVNVSGDFNTHFPRQSNEGRTDREGNGQPSLVYGGIIETEKGAVSQPIVLGRTNQYEPVVELTENTDGITTALELLTSIAVSCR